MQINFKDVNYTYNKKTPYEKKVLKNINLEIEDGSYTVIIGKTGSGKSTLIEHINGLNIAEDGAVEIGNTIIKYPQTRKEKKELAKTLTKLRQDVAVLFQFSEQQLFETTVEKDIIFAPMNYGISEKEAKVRAEKLINLVGLDNSYLNRSPFELSGGEMRKVALCGVLALEPKVLILDEPTIGLDYKSKEDLMQLIEKLKEEYSMNIILVTHTMDYALRFADKVVVVDKGTIAFNGTSKQLFNNLELLEDNSLLLPNILLIKNKLEEKGIIFETFPRKYEDLLEVLKNKIKKGDEDE